MIATISRGTKMSVSQTNAAKRRIAQRYRPARNRSIQSAMENERAKAARMQAAAKKRNR